MSSSAKRVERRPTESPAACDVSVIIPQFGRNELTHHVVRRLRDCESADVEILVVDDGTPDAGSFPWDQWPGVRTLRQPHRGVTAAWNTGIRHAIGRVLVFLNNDVDIRGQFLDRLIASVRSGAALAAGARWRRETSLPASVIPDDLRNHNPALLLEGWCFAVSRDTCRRLAGFDESLRLYFSDTDFQWRLFAASEPDQSPLTVVPGLPLIHAGHATTRQLPDRRTQWHADRQAFLRKWSARARQGNSAPAPASAPRPHLLQVGNVPQITGGTAACAWTVTRALPEWGHTLMFPSSAGPEIRRVCSGINIVTQTTLTDRTVAELGANAVLLHNTPRARMPKRLTSVPTLQYLHSRIDPATTDRTLFCSHWLAEQCAGRVRGTVCHQAVPRPPRPERSTDTRALRDELVIGRLCTPTDRKWPDALVDRYRAWARALPDCRWEFVGCPLRLQAPLREACGNRALFHDADWDARRRLWDWDVLLYHHPSLTESFGRTVAEAMRAGCIPVVDDRGGFREQVASDTGFLCATPGDFTSALETLQELGARRRRSRRCRAHADERFSIAQFRRELLEHLRAV